MSDALGFADMLLDPERLRRVAERPPEGELVNHLACGPGLNPDCPRCGRDVCAGDCTGTARPDRGRPGKVFAPEAVADLYDHTSDQIEWLWHSYVPKGSLVLLPSFMKSGKSTLAYALVAAAVRGVPFLDHETRQTNVLLLALEENRRDVKRRLLKFGVERSAGLFVQFRPVPTDTSEWADLAAFIRERSIGLVVIDTLARYWPCLGVDNENDNAQVSAALAPLLELCRESGVTALVLHHTGKLSEGFGREVRGAGAILALADQALLFDRYRAGDPCDRIIKVLGRYDESPDQTVIRYDRAAGTYAVVRTQEGDEEAHGAERFFPEILTFLRRKKSTGGTLREVRANVHGKSQTKDKAVGLLVARGDVALRNGRYYHADYDPEGAEV